MTKINPEVVYFTIIYDYIYEYIHVYIFLYVYYYVFTFFFHFLKITNRFTCLTLMKDFHFHYLV